MNVSDDQKKKPPVTFAGKSEHPVCNSPDMFLSASNSPASSSSLSLSQPKPKRSKYSPKDLITDHFKISNETAVTSQNSSVGEIDSEEEYNIPSLGSGLDVEEVTSLLSQKSVEIDSKTSEIDSKSSKTDSKSAKSNLKSSKIGLKSTKIDSKLAKTNPKSSKIDSKSTKIDSKSAKSNPKSSKVGSKSTKIDSKLAKTNPKSSKIDSKSTKNLPKLTNSEWLSKKDLKKNSFTMKKEKIREKTGEEIYAEYTSNKDFKIIDPLNNENLRKKLESQILLLKDPSEITADQVNFLLRQNIDFLTKIYSGQIDTFRSIRLKNRDEKNLLNLEVPFGFFKQETINLTSDLLAAFLVPDTHAKLEMVSKVLISEALVTFYEKINKISREEAEEIIARDFMKANKNSFEWN